MAYLNILEQEIKNKVAKDYFSIYDCSKVIGNIDFCVTLNTPKKQNQLFETESLLWAEAKKSKASIIESITQLILTIGKARTFDKCLPPAYLGAFDREKIAFIPYNDLHDIFYQTDFNWTVTSSNYKTKEFKQILDKVSSTIEKKSLLFDFDADDKELKIFIKNNFIAGKSSTSKIKIDKNNFIVIFNKWSKIVQPSISIDWKLAKKEDIIGGDFYLADLLSEKNLTLKQSLSVVLKATNYKLNKGKNVFGAFESSEVEFKDNQKAHEKFWNKYERPPKEEYWDYIINRRDLLVPQDVREVKGSFFTPEIWVELSQKYLTDVLGENWQDDYYIWDCAAGTGNLLAGLTNKHNIWASTLDDQDVKVIHDRIKNGANLVPDNVFRFDFLNGNFTSLPKSLQNVINNPDKRKKLVIYINPPYKEASNKKTLEGGKEGNKGVEQNATNKKYSKLLGQGNAELFAQFLTRIYMEIEGATIAEFSTLKILSGPHFIDFRNFFKAKLKKAFIVPADTFDNVKGKFPIGFMIWDTQDKKRFKKVKADVFDENGSSLGKKGFYSYDDSKYINDWIKPYRGSKTDYNIGKFPFKGNDFQNQNLIAIVHPEMAYNKEAGQFLINQNNLIEACVYYAVRKCPPASWLNDRDQFLFPNEGWESDSVFQNNCLTFTLFSNNIESKYGTNNWIPFTEMEVKARGKFESNFMTDYISGKLELIEGADLFKKTKRTKTKVLKFSPKAKDVFEAGQKLWQYYHKQPYSNLNASWYDIRDHFQGRSDSGKMNNKSDDETYTDLISALRENLKTLAGEIEPKIYEYGFLID